LFTDYNYEFRAAQYMTKTILLNELSADEWQRYFEMIQGVRRKHYPDIYKPD